jgi:hypothetical protein
MTSHGHQCHDGRLRGTNGLEIRVRGAPVGAVSTRTRQWKLQLVRLYVQIVRSFA